MSKKHLGSSVEDFLKAEGIFEEAQAQVVNEVVAWRLRASRLDPNGVPPDVAKGFVES